MIPFVLFVPGETLAIYGAKRFNLFYISYTFLSKGGFFKSRLKFFDIWITLL